LPIYEAALGPDNPLVANVLHGLGEVRLAQGARVDAVELLQRALEIRERADVPPADIEETRSALERARSARGSPRP
jgi:hypothetical protein